jgi:hypothetical protein
MENVLDKAIIFAVKAHEGQTRKDGSAGIMKQCLNIQRSFPNIPHIKSMRLFLTRFSVNINKELGLWKK